MRSPSSDSKPDSYRSHQLVNVIKRQCTHIPPRKNLCTQSCKLIVNSRFDCDLHSSILWGDMTYSAVIFYQKTKLRQIQSKRSSYWHYQILEGLHDSRGCSTTKAAAQRANNVLQHIRPTSTFSLKSTSLCERVRDHRFDRRCLW